MQELQEKWDKDNKEGVDIQSSKVGSWSKVKYKKRNYSIQVKYRTS